ncbi:MAG: hypothetical protein JXX14_08695 [Deltaproteobacteria bacterium]|nr:hypothetical protein [Deltaproteobacteria bacterium]
MKNFKLTVLLAAWLLPGVLTGCAAEKDDTYSTEHNPEYAITYLLTEFEQSNHYNAEGIAAEEGRGYLYMFDDPNTDIDFVTPRAKDSPMCKKVDENGELTDENLSPAPTDCAVNEGYDYNDAAIFDKFGSTQSFHMTGTVAGEGLGFGLYFANYLFYARRDSDDRDKLQRDANGNIPAFFSDGRYDDEGEPICSDDWKFASVIDSKFEDETNRHVFMDNYEGDTDGKYVVTGSAYGPAGSIYTEGHIWVDESGREEFELKYDNTGDIMKEPRCLAEMGQKGFVMWATGDSVVEVVLAMPEAAPLTDGGICDEDAMEKCYDFHKKRFVLDGAWREYHASWDEFLQEGWGKPVVFDPNRIINIQVKVVAPEQGARKFDVWLDHMGFYGGKKWPFVEKLADTEWLVVDTESVTDDSEEPVDSTVDSTVDSGTGVDTTGVDTTDTTGVDTTDTTGLDTSATDTDADTSAADTGTATK